MTQRDMILKDVCGCRCDLTVVYNICDFAVFCAFHDQFAMQPRQTCAAAALFLCGSRASCLYVATNMGEYCYRSGN